MRALLLLLLLPACSVSAPAPARYTGPAPACGRNDEAEVTATLSRLGSSFVLAPYDASLVVSGRIAADGSLRGTLDLHPSQTPPPGSTSKPASRPAQSVVVTGRISAGAAQIDYAAPGCSASLTLARVHPPVF